MGGVLERVIDTLVHTEAASKHVLAAGFRRRRAHDRGMNALSTVECFFPNTLLNHFKTAEWEALLSRVGAEFLCELLLKYTLFAQLRNGCYMQLTGQPMHEVQNGAPSPRREAESVVRKYKGGGLTYGCCYYCCCWLLNSVTHSLTLTHADFCHFLLTRAALQESLGRWRMFYCSSFGKSAGLPAQHVLSAASRKRNGAATSQLVRRIFERPRRKLSPRFVQVLPIFAEVLRRFRRFKCGRLLERHCPLAPCKHRGCPEVLQHPRCMEDADSRQLRWHAYDDGYASQEEDRARKCTEKYGRRISGNVGRAAVAPAHNKRKSHTAMLNAAPLGDLLEMDSPQASVRGFLARRIMFFLLMVQLHDPSPTLAGVVVPARYGNWHISKGAVGFSLQ